MAWPWRTDGDPRAYFWSATTTQARRFKSPLREFLRTESGGAAVLLAATVAALVWVNVDASSYEELWDAVLAIDLDGRGHRADAARVGAQRADDVLLLRAGSVSYTHLTLPTNREV